MFFQKLVEQHRVDRVVAHGVNLALLVAHDQVRVHLGHFLGDQTKLRRVFSVALVMKRHRLKRQDGFAGSIRRFNLLFEPPRRAERAKLAVGVYQDWYGICVCGCNPTNVADKAAEAHVRTGRPDSNNVTGCSDPITGTIAQGGIAAAVDAVFESTLTNGCTLAAGGVVFERILTNGRVGDASVGKERSITHGSVLAASIIAIERFLTDGGIRSEEHTSELQSR